MEVEYDGARFTFVRGFPTVVTCSWEFWREHAAALLTTAPLAVVRLATWPGTHLSSKNAIEAWLAAEYAKNGRPRFVLADNAAATHDTTTMRNPRWTPRRTRERLP